MKDFQFLGGLLRIELFICIKELSGYRKRLWRQMQATVALIKYKNGLKFYSEKDEMWVVMIW